MLPLIDTNIVSEFMRRQPHVAVANWAASQAGFLISVIRSHTLSALSYASLETRGPQGLAPRVEAPVHGFQALAVHMGVDLGGGDVRVA